MRSCRGREWGHGVRSLGGGSGEAWRSEQKKDHGWESEQNLGRARVRVQEGGPKSWLVRREGGRREQESSSDVRARAVDRPKEAGLKH